MPSSMPTQPGPR